MSLAQVSWKLSFQLSPIILTNGIASQIPGGMLPIIAITESLNFADGLLTGGQNIELDDFFANFQPLPNATLIDQQVGMYPFANQAVAANATIAQPLAISMLMICPVREPAGYPLKLATMTALQAALTQHNASGGTYTVATPTYFYTDCIMTSFRDVTTGESNQPQTMWQMDFTKPLLTQQQAQQEQNLMMSKISNGTSFTGNPTWSGPGVAVGQPPSLAAASLIPSSTGAGAAGVASNSNLLNGFVQ